MYQFEVLEKVNPRTFVKYTVRWTLLFIVVMIAMLFLPWQQTVKGVGVLTALDPTHRQYDLLAPVDGFVETFFVTENQFVKKGDPLFSMRDIDSGYGKKMETLYRAGLDQKMNLDLEIKTLHRQQKMLQDLYRNKKEILDAQIVQTEALVDALREREKALSNQKAFERRNYERSKRLNKDGIESQRDMEQKHYTLLRTEAEYRKVTAQLNNTISDLEILKKRQEQVEKEFQLKKGELTNKIYQAQTKRSKIEQGIQKSAVTVDRYKSRLITAKSDGYVIRIHQNDQNRLLKKGERILSFMPNVSQRAIRLKISSFNMPLIQKGVKARIMFYGWPSLYISGWPKISHGTYGGIIYSIEPSSYEDRVYYALVVEDPEDQPWPPFPKLKYGTEATLWIRLSTVPIWYEIWRLLAAQPPKMITPPIKESQ